MEACNKCFTGFSLQHSNTLNVPTIFESKYFFGFSKLNLTPAWAAKWTTKVGFSFLKICLKSSIFSILILFFFKNLAFGVFIQSFLSLISKTNSKSYSSVLLFMLILLAPIILFVFFDKRDLLKSIQLECGSRFWQPWWGHPQNLWFMANISSRQDYYIIKKNQANYAAEGK